MEAGIAHLLEASIKLQCNLEVTARALLLYHHFMRCVAEHPYDETMVAAVALNLSGRVHEQVIDLDSVICVFYSIANQTTDVLSSDDVAYLLIKQAMSRIHCVMLRLLEFNVTHRLAHQYLLPFLIMIFERSKNLADFRKELSATCLRFMSDFYTQRICLEYPPELIAIACIDLGLYVHGLINDLAMIPAWYMGFVCGITPEKVKELKTLIMNVYEKPVLISKPVLPSYPASAPIRALIHPPMLTPRPASRPIPVLTHQPMLTPRPASRPIPVLTHQPMLAPRPGSRPIPVLTHQPALTPVPVLTHQPMLTPPPTLILQPVATSQVENMDE